MNPEAISILVPAHNESEAIGSVLKALRNHFPAAELIVVDDGSSDGTGEIAREAGAIVLHHDKRQGYGASLRTGIACAKRDYVLFCDGDGQHDMPDVRRLMEACEGHDMVIGARNQESHRPFKRRIGKAIIAKFANFLANERIPDINSGLRIVNKKVIKKYLHIMPNGFSFSTTSTFAFIKSNRRIHWVPITVHPRKGKSQVRQLKDGPRILLLLLRLSVLFEPLKIFLICTGILLVLSLASFTTDMCLSNGEDIGDTTVILSVATLLVFLFGLLCDQVSAIRREIHE